MTEVTYLVVEPVEIIATDLALNIKDFDPTAIVLTAMTPTQALNAIADRRSVRFALVHADPKGFEFSPLGAALLDRGCRVVFMGNSADMMKDSYAVLERPFSTSSTVALLTQLSQSQCRMA